MTKATGAATLAVSALALALGGPASAAEVDFDAWDTHGDGQLSRQEFQAGLRNAGIFGKWDADGDGRLSRDELDEGIERNPDRYAERFGDVDLWGVDLGHDNYLTDNEFYDGIYGAYDADANDVLEAPEFGDLGDDMGDEGFWDN